ncbi:Glycosyl transferase family 2 [Rhizobiales bacterium GAS188]|nr:Glycosyl transferase family 2 [Rhizobiales bacterium GAS188]
MTPSGIPEAAPPDPMVSVIMANYNGAAHLADAIGSVQRQSLRDLEIIVSDDASRDGSVEIATELMREDPRVRLVQSERNAGPGAARNRALALARGQWIAVIDSDDLMHPERLATLVDGAVRDGADIVADDLVAFHADDLRPTSRLLTGRWARAPFWVDIADYVRLNHFYGRGPALGYLKPLFRASLLQGHAARYDETLRIAEDYDLVFRLLHGRARFRVYPVGLYYYRKHPASTSHRLNRSALGAIEAADLRFLGQVPSLDRCLATAVAARLRSIRTALAYEDLLAALKGEHFWRAAGIALARPKAAALLRLPISVRLRRLLPSRAGFASGRRIILAIGALLVAGATIIDPGTRIADRIISPASAEDLRPKGEKVSGEGQPSIFNVRRASNDKIIDGYDAQKGDKIRLTGFGLSDFDAVRHNLRQVGKNALLKLPGGQSLWVLGTDMGSLGADNFQLELDRHGLVKTFADEFSKFSWYAEGLENAPIGGGTWRTNFGYAGAQELGSRSLGSNGELQVYVDRGFRGTADKPLGIDPFRVANGALEIVADRAPPEVSPRIWNYQYTSGLITTERSFSQLYGVFEIRARMPKGRGLWPDFWLLPADHSWPPEIDVFEILAHDTTTLHTNAHSNAGGKHTDAPTVIRVPDTSADFHTYAVDWQADTIKWYFDDVEVARKPTPPDMHKQMYMLANFAVGGHWPGNPDASTQFPAILAIDWIRAYRRNAPPK